MNHRNEQIRRELLKVLGIILFKLFPQQRFGLITVTDVIVNKGLDEAKIFVSSFEKGPLLVKALNKKIHLIHQELLHQVALRKIPRLEFIYDDSKEKHDKIEQALKNTTS